MTQVFLSHSTLDADFAQRLADDLRAAGVPVWKAPESILPGEEWVAAIERGIATSTHLLLLQSPAAVESRWVRFEFNAALTLEKQGKMRIVPISYRPCSAPLFWTQFQCVTGIVDSYRPALDRILARLREERPVQPPPPTLPSTTIDVITGGGQGGPAGAAEGEVVTYPGQPVEPPATALSPLLGPGERPARTRQAFEPEVVLIPAGPFLMGSPDSDRLRRDNEPEQFELTLDHDYAIGKYPVTVGQYRAFVRAGGYANRDFWTAAGWEQRKAAGWAKPGFWGEPPWTDRDDLPVVGLSWYEAYAYTRWLSEAAGRDYRLPTEAEWEKAARGGLQIPDGKGGTIKNPHPARCWPWGNGKPTQALCDFNGNYLGGRTSPVTSHAAQAERQPYGLYHMAGNVFEWCLSNWAEAYAYPEDTGPEGSRRRVLRGGSWKQIDGIDSRSFIRAAFRYPFRPDQQWENHGMRVVLVEG